MGFSGFFTALADSGVLEKDFTSIKAHLEPKAIRAANIGAGVILMPGQVERLVRQNVQADPGAREISPLDFYRQVQSETVAYLQKIIDMQKEHAPVRSYDPDNEFVKFAGQIRYPDPHGPARMYPGV